MKSSHSMESSATSFTQTEADGLIGRLSNQINQLTKAKVELKDHHVTYAEQLNGDADNDNDSYRQVA